MAMHDINSRIKPVFHIGGTVSSTQTPSAGVDTKGFEAVSFLISIGTISNIAESPTPSWTFKLQESDASTSGFTDVTDSNAVLIDSSASPVVAPDASTGVFLTIDAAAEDAAVYMVGYLGTKRYVRCVATATETPGNTPLAVTALLGDPSQLPTDH